MNVNPTIFHITHYKAGSQWIYQVLRLCQPDRVVTPKVGVAHFFDAPLRQGKIYPTVYVSREQFESVALPSDWRRFIIIRDLRDTVVSAYFSLKISHPIISDSNAMCHDKLNALSMREGFMFILEKWLPTIARIQESWLESGEPLIHYEDLLTNDFEILEPVLIEKCRLPITQSKLKEAILASRFEAITKGRRRGQEDVTSHCRKGVQGDWKNYFDDNIKKAFKNRYQDLLIHTGYEKNNDW